MAGALPDGQVYLDGAAVTVCEVRTHGYCTSCGVRSNLASLLVGKPDKGAARRWVIARQHGERSFVTHHCKDLETAAAA